MIRWLRGCPKTAGSLKVGPNMSKLMENNPMFGWKRSTDKRPSAFLRSFVWFLLLSQFQAFSSHARATHDMKTSWLIQPTGRPLIHDWYKKENVIFRRIDGSMVINDWLAHFTTIKDNLPKIHRGFFTQNAKKLHHRHPLFFLQPGYPWPPRCEAQTTVRCGWTCWQPPTLTQSVRCTSKPSTSGFGRIRLEENELVSTCFK